jgi:hypothetical protein
VHRHSASKTRVKRAYGKSYALHRIQDTTRATTAILQANFGNAANQLSLRNNDVAMLYTNS